MKKERKERKKKRGNFMSTKSSFPFLPSPRPEQKQRRVKMLYFAELFKPLRWSTTHAPLHFSSSGGAEKNQRPLPLLGGFNELETPPARSTQQFLFQLHDSWTCWNLHVSCVLAILSFVCAKLSREQNMHDETSSRFDLVLDKLISRGCWIYDGSVFFSSALCSTAAPQPEAKSLLFAFNWENRQK